MQRDPSHGIRFLKFYLDPKHSSWLSPSFIISSFYRSQRSWGKVMLLHVCDSVHRGVVLSQHALQVVSQHALQHVSRGCLLLGGCLVPGGAWSRRVPSPEGVGAWSRGCLIPGVPGGDPPGWLLLLVVRILLEYILVVK